MVYARVITYDADMNKLKMLPNCGTDTSAFTEPNELSRELFPTSVSAVPNTIDGNAERPKKSANTTIAGNKYLQNNKKTDGSFRKDCLMISRYRRGCLLWWL